MKYRLLKSALGLAVATFAFPAVASADCQPEESVEAALRKADIAFVGTAIAAPPGGGAATFRVEETWAGTVGASVEVFGLNGREPAEDDRTWQAGARYLVIPYVVEGRLVDHICSGSTPWKAELAAIRPAGATIASAAADPAVAPPWPVILVLLVVGAGAVVGWIAFRGRA